MNYRSRAILLDAPPSGRAVEAESAGSSHPHVDGLANLVRSLYCVCFREFTGDAAYGTQHMDAWDGDPEGNSGRRTTRVWPKIARKIIEQQADPFQYVRSQFYATKLARAPSPNTFYSDAAVAKYEAFRCHARKDVEQRVASDVNQIQLHALPFTVNLGWDPVRSLDYALRSPTCGASPLVRYCYAVSASLEVAPVFLERALLQYVFQMSDYDAVLGNRIPADLRDAAEQCRRQLVG